MHNVKNEDYIISLQGLCYTQLNTYICVRTPKSINLFINEFFIRKIEATKEEEKEEKKPYINFKVIEYSDPESFHVLILMMKLQKDLSSYTIDILDIFEIFPLFKPLSEIFFYITFWSNAKW